VISPLATTIVSNPAVDTATPHLPDEVPDPLARLTKLIDHAGRFLPAQGPINVFIHHNTLHAFEHLPFDEGVRQGGRLFGCQPYLSEDRYREMLNTGRIRPADLAAVLVEDLGDRADELLGFMGTRFHLRMALLEHPLRIAPAAELRWFVAETDALRCFRKEASPQLRQAAIATTQRWTRHIVTTAAAPSEEISDRRQQGFAAAVQQLVDRFNGGSLDRWSAATWEAFTLQLLWRVCREGVHGLKRPTQSHPQPIRHRDWLLETTGVDSDELVHEVLIRFCAAFLDQGLSHWPLPNRTDGFLRSFAAVYTQPAGPPDAWLAELSGELRRLTTAGTTPIESIRESLEHLGVPPAEWESFITATLLALRGWAGMIRQVEERGDRAACPIPAGSLIEFLAARLVLERLALAHVAKARSGYTGPLAELRPWLAQRRQKPAEAGVDQRAFIVFQLAQVRGWSPADLHGLSRKEWTLLVAELEAFSGIERRRVMHAAYERRYRIQTLDAVACHGSRPHDPPVPPKFQIACCLDEREESFRRHLEEIAPPVETFGVAGFFAVAMYYRGAAQAHFVPLCPIVIRPQHWVVEEAGERCDELHQRRAKARRVLGAASHRLHVGSRSFTAGALLTAAFGALATVPLVARVLFPRLTAKVRDSADLLFRPPQETVLGIERAGTQPAAERGHYGYSLEEMTSLVERLLREMGLTSGFARLVLILGHGSNSLNNPHNSAYNCGACGGNAGGPNARAFSQIANDPRVRERLVERGITIPADTSFVGGMHNTCNDEVAWFDQDRVPASHQDEFSEAKRAIDEACRRNAHERCRRFVSAPLNMSFVAAKRHVEARAEDLAQVRPECGHASNAVTFVGRRNRTRGLYMDRRTFLTSYNPTQDDEQCTILTRVLSAAVPVCAGISLEYYFSYVDSAGYGCGTKLPHNVASLLGVMDGAGSDLRTGLPWQMVEIHEPVRSLFIIETTPEKMARIMDCNPGIGRVCRNGWVQLATLDPHSSRIHVLQGGRFERYEPESVSLPRVTSSTEWYRGQRDHLPYALIES
jgi:uncharacterized protein YbcC (UPF0753/DUF2309 family)